MLTPATPVITHYNRYPIPGQNGVLASMINFVADSRIVETSAGIGFGLAVSQGTGAQGCIIGGTAFVGLTRTDITLPRSESLTLDKYAHYDTAAILATGDLWVIPGGTVHAGDAVYYNATTGQLGWSGGTVIEDARWMTGLTTGTDYFGNSVTLAVVRIGNIAGNR